MSGLSFRFRVILPAAFLVLSIVLATVGDWQRQRVIDSVGRGAVHGVPQRVAVARFMDYAINAPAWIATWQIPNFINHFPSWGIMSTEFDWRYLLLVCITWYLIGAMIDRKRSSPPRVIPVAWKRVLGVLATGYGIFMCRDVAPLEWWFDPWFIDCVFLWGFFLTVAALVSLLRVSGSDSGRGQLHQAIDSTGRNWMLLREVLYFLVGVGALLGAFSWAHDYFYILDGDVRTASLLFLQCLLLLASGAVLLLTSVKSIRCELLLSGRLQSSGPGAP